MIQVVHRAIDILEFIRKSPQQAAGLAEIADSLNLNRATCSNILRTLTDRNMLEQNDNREYCYGPLIYRLTDGSFYDTDLVEAAKDVMEELSDQLNENTILAVIHKHKRVTIYEVESDHELHVKNRITKEAYETATGRLLLAFLPEKELKSFLRKKGLPTEDSWPEACHSDTLYRILEEIRVEKMTIQESLQHVVGFAAPVFNGELVVASLGVFLPAARLSEAHRRKIVSLLGRAATVISQNLTEGINQPLLEAVEST
ncbi:IclR family transcriptional regulator [Tunicatimonas pelagia]|uniref:IclR family transcriptional regulator n=1 Tax=Tunicatimonas pelagia TaxID=931531 RepID=UPI002666921A|nr:IclR family transcriptional regulator [Tunicatimonas pelagia]WKN42780.1 IclR family transcriptional regulator [Tunicatimonas pelagia]